MFNGVIEHTGKLISRQQQEKNYRLKVEAPAALVSQVQIGDSVSNNGVCLSIVQIEGSLLHFDLLTETLEKTCLGQIPIGQKINLELPMQWGQKINGHFISGHVDTTALLKRVESKASGTHLFFELKNPDFQKLIAPKGSIAVDGISLTLVSVQGSLFEVALIPLTLEITNLGQKQVGDEVNIEVDLIARYVEKMGQSSFNLKNIYKKLGQWIQKK